jgi:hypothetical protein
LPAIGHTLMRGQVGLLLLLLLCGMARALVRRRPTQAGLWLAGAICLKVIPAFLLLYPLYRRDGRCLAGCALGLLLGLVVIPAAALGPARTWAYYREWMDVLVQPALGTGTDQSRAKELIEVTATDSQSLQVVLHNTLHPEGTTRPPHPAAWVRAVHWGVGGLLTLLTLWVARGRRSEDAPGCVLLLGALTVIMLLISPVCHLHYFCLSLPLVMGLLAAAWEQEAAPRLGKGMALLMTANVVANTLPHLPALAAVREDGLAMYAGLLLWLTATAVLWKRPRPNRTVSADRPRVVRVAA